MLIRRRRYSLSQAQQATGSTLEPMISQSRACLAKVKVTLVRFSLGATNLQHRVHVGRVRSSTTRLGKKWSWGEKDLSMVVASSTPPPQKKTHTHTARTSYKEWQRGGLDPVEDDICVARTTSSSTRSEAAATVEEEASLVTLHRAELIAADLVALRCVELVTGWPAHGGPICPAPKERKEGEAGGGRRGWCDDGQGGARDGRTNRGVISYCCIRWGKKGIWFFFGGGRG